MTKGSKATKEAHPAAAATRNNNDEEDKENNKKKNAPPVSKHSMQIDFCCEFCMEVFPQLKECKGCKLVSYCCSKECQRMHWNETHKDECATLRQIKKSTGDNLCREDRKRRAERFIAFGKYKAAEKELRAIIEDEPEPRGIDQISLGAVLKNQGDL